MKKLLLLCLATLCVLFTWAGQNDKYDFSVDGIYYYKLSDGSVAVIDSAYQHATSTYTGDLVIPASVEYEGTPYTVSSIFEYAFYRCSGLISITLPETITNLGSYAFGYCDELTELTIPDGIKSVASGLCFYCKSLKSVNIPTTVTSISSDAFNCCSSLTYVAMPSDITSIGSYAFSSCSSLMEIVIPEKVTSIGQRAFASSGLDKLYSLNTNPPSAGTNAFYKITTTCTLYVPQGCLEVYSSADLWGDFTSIVEIDEAITPPTVVTLSVTDITNSTATLHGTVSAGSEEILETGFQYWADTNATQTIVATSISDDEISSTIQRLSSATEYTFRAYATTAIETTYGERMTFTTTNYDFAEENSDGQTIYYKILSSSGANRNCEVQYLYYMSEDNIVAYEDELVIPKTVTHDGTTYNVTQINEYAFYECSNLTKVTIPESVTAIGPYSFYNCTSLVEVVLPNTISTIWEYTFYGCINLKEVIIPSSVTTIREYAFCGCNNITELTIPGTVKTLHTGMFANCANLKKVTLEEGVTNTGYSYMFAGCTSLEEVSMPNTMTEFGGYTFGGCTGLKSFTYPNSMTDTGAVTFYECRSLEDITFSRNIIEVTHGTFAYCNLEKMEVPEGVTTIGYQTFMHNPNLTSITFPKTLTSANYQVCYDCPNLSTVFSLNPTPPLLDVVIANVRGWFDGRKDDCILYVPTGSRDEYASATGWKDFNSIVEIDVLSAETAEATDITKDSATLNGTVSKGTFDVTSKGFEYWTDPLVSTFVAIEGGDLTAPLSDLESGTTYYYRAYATDTTGTTYGETLSFTTDFPEGISSVSLEDYDIEGYYSISGLKLNAPQRGVNIVHYVDGTTKKVIMK